MTRICQSNANVSNFMRLEQSKMKKGLSKRVWEDPCKFVLGLSGQELANAANLQHFWREWCWFCSIDC